MQQVVVPEWLYYDWEASSFDATAIVVRWPAPIVQPNVTVPYFKLKHVGMYGTYAVFWQWNGASVTYNNGLAIKFGTEYASIRYRGQFVALYWYIDDCASFYVPIRASNFGSRQFQCASLEEFVRMANCLYHLRLGVGDEPACECECDIATAMRTWVLWARKRLYLPRELVGHIMSYVVAQYPRTTRCQQTCLAQISMWKK